MGRNPHITILDRYLRVVFPHRRAASNGYIPEVASRNDCRYTTAITMEGIGDSPEAWQNVLTRCRYFGMGSTPTWVIQKPFTVQLRQLLPHMARAHVDAEVLAKLKEIGVTPTQGGDPFRVANTKWLLNGEPINTGDLVPEWDGIQIL